MRIGFFGNTNNYPFLLARALREMGHEVHLVINRGEGLHRPEYRASGAPYPYPSWIEEIPLRRVRQIVFPSAARQAVVARLQACDAVVLNEFGPALLPRIGRPGVVMLTGSDLESLAHRPGARRLVKSGNALYRTLRVMGMARFARMQRRGIAAASVVAYFAPGIVPEGDHLLTSLGVSEARRISLMMADIDAIPLRPYPENPVVRVFNVARLTWKRSLPTTSELDLKGTDVMIRGLGRFVRRSGTSLDIRLVRKGLHVRETEDLSRDEGLEDMITWCDELTQSEVIEEYAASDIVFDQLGEGTIGMGGLDALASGRPVIANARPEIIEQLTGEDSPVCQARTPEEVELQLSRLAPDRALRESIGLRSRQYVLSHFSPAAAARISLEALERNSPTRSE